MSAHRVRTLVQSTAEVEPERAFEFWRHTALAMTGVVSSGLDRSPAFAARRLVAETAHSTLLHTQSRTIDIARPAQHIRRDGRDAMAIAVFVRGTGYAEQGNRGARMAPGDISIVDASRPYRAGGYEDYEEIRLITSRALFRAHVGEPETFAGHTIGRGHLNTLFVSYLQAYAGQVATMSEAQAGIAVEGGLHLLRSFTGVSEDPIPVDALRSLASVHIQRRLHDPEFGPDALCRTLCVSRSRLYAAFADGDGVAASIRDARLERARRYLSVPAHAHDSIATIMLRCGFTDASAFSRAFRRRFGIAARDVRTPRSGDRLPAAGSHAAI
ncbi:MULTISPECIES: helix-turn-helix domain-containing protein [Methylobacterium]|uniref:helix-turn-helix domain-containing protein n=1 Tax=Methylobacterium TaxID=407 RepID=UPI001EE2B5D7|nr:MULTISPECIES: helix-turn-helix domain-containing protein [Methylobacterium]GJE24404.1 HTH-type transcriptional activator RhaS [Methylobacterium mesophilicum]